MKKSPFRAFETAHEQSHLKDVLSESGIDVTLLHGKKQGTFTLQWIDKTRQSWNIRSTEHHHPTIHGIFFLQVHLLHLQVLFLNAISFLCLHVYLRIVLDDSLWVWEISF